MKDNDKRCEHAHKEHINRFKMAHNIGVAEYMRENAEKYGLPADEMYVMGLLHDIGYIKQHKGHEEYGAELLETMGLKPDMYMQLNITDSTPILSKRCHIRILTLTLPTKHIPN